MSGAVRRTLQRVALALAVSFAVGLAAGTWLRCRMERAPAYIGARPAERPGAGLLAPATFPFDVADAGSPVLDAREHEEQVRETVEVADRARRE